MSVLNRNEIDHVGVLAFTIDIAEIDGEAERHPDLGETRARRAAALTEGRVGFRSSACGLLRARERAISSCAIALSLIL